MKYVVLYAVFIYIGLMAFIYFFSERFIFQPPPSTYKDSTSIIKLKTRTGTNISAIYLPNPVAKYTVLISHGNAEDLGSIAPLLTGFHAQGFAVFAYDYAGYGTSEGKASEQQAYADVDAAYDYLTQQLNVSPTHIIAYGRSLGGAMAVDLASRKPVAGVILEAPFITAFRVITFVRIFPFDKFTSLQKIKTVHCPILIIHGTQDRVVPFWHGKKLYESFASPKTFLWVKDAGHNNIIAISGENYWDAIKQFAATLKTPN